jgi:hypothetical protein
MILYATLQQYKRYIKIWITVQYINCVAIVLHVHASAIAAVLHQYYNDYKSLLQYYNFPWWLPCVHSAHNHFAEPEEGTYSSRSDPKTGSPAPGALSRSTLRVATCLGWRGRPLDGLWACSPPLFQSAVGDQPLRPALADAAAELRLHPLHRSRALDQGPLVVAVVVADGTELHKGIVKVKR